MNTQTAKTPGKRRAQAKGKADVVSGETKVTKVADGVATGAADPGQPHTRRSVQQNKAKGSKLVPFKTAKGTTIQVDPTDPQYCVDGKFIANVTRLNDAKRAAEAPKAPAKEKAAPKAKEPKQPTATKTYKVLNKDHGAKPDSKRAKQLEIVFAHKDTQAAKAKGAEQVDFAFAISKGFIQYT